MRCLVVAQGSHGDINPPAAMAVELKRRGHEAVFIASEYYEPLARRLGLELIPTTSRAEFLRVISHADFGRPRKSWLLQTKGLLAEIEPVYQAIADRYQPGNTVVIAPLQAVGARIANEKLGVPLASVALSPIWIRSVHQPVALSEDAFRRIPMFVRKGLRHSTDWLMDWVVMKEITSARKKLGLPPVRPLRDGWSLSPQLVLGLFPEWFASYQPDWPPQMRLTDFAMLDNISSEGLPQEVEEFLAAGPPPVVVNALSAKPDSKSFFETSVAALRSIQRRGILLSLFADFIPKNLPSGIGYFGYVPHSALLPRAAAIIHQGGVGTVAKSIAAGIPQLIIPFMHDQFFNAQKVRSLGLGDKIYGFQFKTARVARALERLLASESVARNCAAYTNRFHGPDGATLACDVVEQMLCT